MRLDIPFLTLLALFSTCEATTVFRCASAAGQITYSQHGCATDQSQTLQEVFNPTPGSGAAVPMARPERPRSPSPRQKENRSKRNDVTVVGEQQNGCGNRVIGSDRRKAIIEGRIKTGMTQGDVESALGRPDTVSQQNGTTRFHYKADKRHGARTVSFDEDGCVMGKKKR